MPLVSTSMPPAVFTGAAAWAAPPASAATETISVANSREDMEIPERDGRVQWDGRCTARAYSTPPKINSASHAVRSTAHPEPVACPHVQVGAEARDREIFLQPHVM